MPESYRRNAGIVVFNRNRQVLLCRRNDNVDAWQFPQGGIEPGETVEQAALRELKEETSLHNVILVKSLTAPARYTFPPQILASVKKRGFKNLGQDIYWSLVYFGGDDAEIDLQTSEPEFSAYQWSDFATACALIIDFKKTAYLAARDAFETIINNFEIPV